MSSKWMLIIWSQKVSQPNSTLNHRPLSHSVRLLQKVGGQITHHGRMPCHIVLADCHATQGVAGVVEICRLHGLIPQTSGRMLACQKDVHLQGLLMPILRATKRLQQPKSTRKKEIQHLGKVERMVKGFTGFKLSKD